MIKDNIFWKSSGLVNGYEYSLRYAHKEEIELMSHTVNAEEMLEVWRLFNLDVEEALKSVFLVKEKRGLLIFSLYQKNNFEENIIAMGGLVPLNMDNTNGSGATSLVAEIWFLGTDMDKHSRFIVKYAKEILQKFLNTYPILINVVGAWNKRNIRWLRSLGFCVEKTPHKMGMDNAFFHRFYITKDMFEK